MSILNGNGNSFSGNGQNGFEDMIGDLKAQEAASTNKRTYPASPEDFIKWVRQTLRDQRQLLTKLTEEHKKLDKAGELATVGLKRLGALIRADDRLQYEHLLDLHRNFTFKQQNIGYSLLKCRQVLDETTTNMQFVGETLRAVLADRHKKIAAQKELGLRLRDTDADFDRCKRAVGAQNKTFRQLSEGIQMLMNKAKLKLPPKVQEQMNREDEVERLAIMHKKSLEKGHDVINSKEYIPPKAVGKIKMLSGYGQQDASTATETANETSTEVKEAPDSSTESSAIDPKIAFASTTVGLIVGILIFYVVLAR